MPRSEHALAFPYYRSPQSIRSELFSQRPTGLNPDKVDQYLDLPAGQVETTERERLELLAGSERLRACGADRRRCR